MTFGVPLQAKTQDQGRQTRLRPRLSDPGPKSGLALQRMIRDKKFLITNVASGRLV